MFYHAELGLGLLNKVLLLWLADAGEDARLWVEVQHVALEISEEVSKAANTAQAHHTLDSREKENMRNWKNIDWMLNMFTQCKNIFLLSISREKNSLRYIITLERDIFYINEPQQGAGGHLLSTFYK